ncbi:MAG: xanthine dehydrogenase family protein subunit M [Actinomycetota bacterium]|nr:xanthine dehydrogenase family protein subunit M [Actinomycetota bacterium]
MIPAAFDYVRPDSISSAVSAISEAGEDGKVLAGGQSLIPVLRLRLAYPSTVVDIGRVPELRGVRDDGDAIVIGSMTTHHDVLHDALVAEHAPLIAQATATVADPQVRHRGTFGGALAHADPAGDLGAVALALGCEFIAVGPSGERRIAAADFFLDYLTTALSPDELLTAVRVPKLGAGWSSHYEKFNRVAQAWSIVAVAAVVRRENGSIAEARIGLTNMGSTPLRATATEQALAGADASADAVAAAAAHAADGTEPPSDLSGKSDYREHLARVLTKRAVLAAAGV